MSDKYCVKLIHSCLKDKSKWFIDFHCPDISEMQDVCERAKESADMELSKLSVNALYSRYQKWVRGNPIIPPNAHYFSAFMDDVVNNIGIASLKGDEKYLFEENCFLTHTFIKN